MSAIAFTNTPSCLSVVWRDLYLGLGLAEVRLAVICLRDYAIAGDCHLFVTKRKRESLAVGGSVGPSSVQAEIKGALCSRWSNIRRGFQHPRVSSQLWRDPEVP